MKELTPQILAMYLGCEIEDHNGTRGTLSKVDLRGFVNLQLSTEIGQNIGRLVEEVKPVLRRLSSMTEEERLFLINAPAHWNTTMTIDTRTGLLDEVNGCEPHHPETMRTWWPNKISPEHFQYLLSKRFDLFGLIDNGLAVELEK